MDDARYEAMTSFGDLKGPPQADQMRSALERCAAARPGERMTIVAAMDATHALSAFAAFAEDEAGQRRFAHATGILSSLVKDMCLNVMSKNKCYAVKVVWLAGGDWTAHREDARDPLVTELLVQIAKMRIEARALDRDGLGGMLEINLADAPRESPQTMH